jgi:glyoxylase-like metal-dependent hydrolase (beta-lactamase superfamily II)
MTPHALVRAALATLFCGTLFIATPQLEPPKLTISKVKDNLHVIEGDGGNTGVYVTDQGAILVDDKFPRDVEAILDKVKSVTAQPVKYLLNTHHHGDHTGGNEKMLAQNVEIIAHRNARVNIVEKKQPGPGRLTFSDEFEVHLGGKLVQARYFGRSHTNGDAVVYFPELKTVHMGDMFVRQAPFIDYTSGGSAIEWTKTVDGVLTLDFDTVIPGHGAVCTRADLIAWRKSFEQMRTRMSGLSRKFDKAEDAVAQLKLEDFGWTSNPGILKRYEGLYTEMKTASK